MTITDSDLTAILPITYTQGRGELPLSEKISSYITHGVDFLHREIMPLQLLTSFTRPHAVTIAAAHALWEAVPALDIALTSNGFAIGSNDTLAPASPARVRSLRQSILETRDKAIESLVSIILLADHTSLALDTSDIPGPSDGDILSEDTSETPSEDSSEDTISPSDIKTAWLSSAQSEKFTGTLLSMRRISEAVEGKLSYDTFIRVLPAVKAIEDDTARLCISFPVMRNLRAWMHHTAGTPPEVSMHYSRILPALTSFLQKKLHHDTTQSADPAGLMTSERYLSDIVQYIRSHSEIFPEWQDTDTAALYRVPPFRNQKRSGGYFF